jgi:hypothetical protein
MINEFNIESMAAYHYKFTTIQKILNDQVAIYHRLIDYLDL